ncbi:MAG: hydroxylamine reductase [Bacteroidales bacterium]|jgi:hydroxylamine reductase|nr:hydroxylamine reductase [Bacteroidales bacterium]
MFCYQCQETAKGIGCTISGVCGKKEDVSNLQDLLIHILKGISLYSNEARKTDFDDSKINRFIIESLFTTITNANFDKEVFYKRVRKALEWRDLVKNHCISKNLDISHITHDSAVWSGTSEAEMEEKSKSVGILSYENEDIRSLVHLMLFGVKGMAAYAEHASNLGHENEEIHAFVQKALAESTRNDLTADYLISLVMETGKYGVEVMSLLDKANTGRYGNPEITKVNIGVKNNPGILISGHDLRDLEDLLDQTEGSGVDVYTHSEMLPAHYFPFFKKYKSFAGNYGNAWWKQREEFEPFNGPILFTTNCIVPPSANATYKDRVYTTGAAGFTGCKHIPDRENGGKKDFSEIIEHAKKCNPPTAIENGEIIGGFAHAQVIALADKVVEAVKSGSIRKFIVMAGCDGRMKDRDYYTQFAQKLPNDTIILTAGCAKYRYNKLPLGEINGIPRVLDAGQCNDSYSLAVIALKLKEVFNLNNINDLPIVYNIAWYEQKAVIVLLSLLYLGVKNIHLGPTLPAFLSPNVAKVLVENFNISGITTPDEDIKILLN